MWQREKRVAKGKKGDKGKEGWQRERRVENFNESRMAKGGFSFGKLNLLNYVF